MAERELTAQDVAAHIDAKLAELRRLAVGKALARAVLLADVGPGEAPEALGQQLLEGLVGLGVD